MERELDYLRRIGMKLVVEVITEKRKAEYDKIVEILGKEPLNSI